MPKKIKNPTNLLIKESVVMILWELAEAHKKGKIISGYKIAKKLGFDAPLIYDYMKRWLNAGLVISKEENGWVYFSLNPSVFCIKDNSISFDIGNVKVTLVK